MKEASAAVLYISYDGMTDPLGQSQVLPYLKGLSRLGYKIHLISFEKPENFAQLRQVINEQTEAFGISWHPLKYHKSPKVLSTVYDIYSMFRAAGRICREHNVKIIHCRSYIAALAGLHFKQKLGLRFLFDMRGFWADERVEGNIWNLNNPLFKWIYSYFKKKEKEFLLEAHAIVSLTTEGKEIIMRDHGKNLEKKISVIPCCADLSHFSIQKVDPGLVKEFSQKYKITNQDKLLVYVGSLGTWYMTAEMLRFFKIAKELGKFTRFLVITKDDPSTFYEEAKEAEVQLDSLIVAPAQRHELPSFLSLCQWSVFFIRPTFSKKASSPTKMAEILGMGLGVITNTGVGDSDAILGPSGCGVLLDDFNEDSFRNAAQQLNAAADPKLARATAEKYFSLDQGVEHYNSIYQELLLKK